MKFVFTTYPPIHRITLFFLLDIEIQFRRCRLKRGRYTVLWYEKFAIEITLNSRTDHDSFTIHDFLQSCQYHINHEFIAHHCTASNAPAHVILSQNRQKLPT